MNSFRFYFFKPLLTFLKFLFLWRLSHFKFQPSSLQAWSFFYQTEKEQETPHSFLYFAWMVFRHGIPDYSDPLALYKGLDDRGFLFEEMTRILHLKQDSNFHSLMLADMAFRRFVFLMFLQFPLNSFYEICGDKKFTSFFSNILVHHRAESWGISHEDLSFCLRPFLHSSHLLVLKLAHHSKMATSAQSHSFLFVCKNFIKNIRLQRTLEKNPTSLDIDKIRDWKKMKSSSHAPRLIDKVALEFTDFTPP